MAVTTRFVIADNAGIGELTVPPEYVRSATATLTSSLDGSEVAVDVADPVIHVTAMLTRVLFVPSGSARFRLADGRTFTVCGDPADLSLLPYGTPVDWYEGDGILIGKFYVEGVERVGRELWQMHMVSALGLLDNVDHAGGLYRGKTVGQLLEEIIGTTFAYSVDQAISGWAVYGWLKYRTARDNLHQLLLAYGINIGRTAAGLPYFTVLPFGETVDVPDAQVYSEGSVEFRAPVTSVSVTEHSFWEPVLGTEEELFSNADGTEELDGYTTFVPRQGLPLTRAATTTPC